LHSVESLTSSLRISAVRRCAADRRQRQMSPGCASSVWYPDSVFFRRCARSTSIRTSLRDQALAAGYRAGVTRIHFRCQTGSGSVKPRSSLFFWKRPEVGVGLVDVGLLIRRWRTWTSWRFRSRILAAGKLHNLVVIRSGHPRTIRPLTCRGCGRLSRRTR